jgi:hypothetical protein
MRKRCKGRTARGDAGTTRQYRAPEARQRPLLLRRRLSVDRRYGMNRVSTPAVASSRTSSLPMGPVLPVTVLRMLP